jgi:hypothetical protein
MSSPSRCGAKKNFTHSHVPGLPEITSRILLLIFPISDIYYIEWARHPEAVQSNFGSNSMQYGISKHAQRRMNQRGITHDFIAALIDYADIEVPVGSNSSLLRVSRAQGEHLNIDDRLGHYGIIFSEDGNVITVLPIHRGNSGRRYRRINWS